MKPDITRRELARHLANKDAKTGDISGLLESIHEPTTSKELSEQYPVTRQQIHEIMEPLEPWAVERSKGGLRKINTLGEIARRAYVEAGKEIGPDDLAWLAWSDNRGRILYELQSAGSASAKELSSIEGLPEKRTIRRSFEEFDERGWVILEEKTQSRTVVAKPKMDGERVSRAYDDLLLKLGQVIDKCPCLRDLGLECADIPVESLSDAEMVEATPESPFQIESRVRKLADADFQYFRSFQSHWNGENAKAFYKNVKAGKQFEVISPPLGLSALPTDREEVECVIGGLKAENYRWRMYRNELPCSLAILNDEQMIVGPRDPGSANNTRTGAILSDNDRLVEWAVETYERHRQETQDPFEISLGFSIGVKDLIELLTSRHLSDREAQSD